MDEFEKFDLVDEYDYRKVSVGEAWINWYWNPVGTCNFLGQEGGLICEQGKK